LTSSDAKTVNAPDRYGYTALHSAASKSDINPRILIVKKKKNP